MTPIFIDTAEKLDQHIQGWRTAEFLAIDTEFVREQTYYPKLCLIQISAGDLNACIDPLAIKDLKPLLDLLLQPSSVSVFHAASQDLEIFVRLCGQSPQPLFDTQIAAALLGYGDQLGYAGLVKKTMGIELDKSLSRTNWARRPLNDKELAYAADDVRYLAELYPRLKEELKQRGRLEWMQQDCEALAQADRYLVHPEREWKRLKGLARLDANAQNIAANLAQWRETVAEKRDRPRRWILADDALYTLAQRQPRSLDQLADLQALPAKTLDTHGAVLIGLIEQTLEENAPARVVEKIQDDEDKKRLKRMLERARGIAQELEIPSSMLATRADIEALVEHADKADIALLRGWRREVAGEQLLGELT